MKKIMILAVAVLMGVGSMSAQRGGGRQKMTVEQMVNNMAKELDLTADQQKKITAIYTDFEQKRKSGAETSREQMRADRQELDKQVNAVLTDAQKAKYEEMKKARRGGGKRKP
ncbi:MAG: hypothetical protein ACI3YT_08200 [Prevotella sp.]